MTTAFTKWTNKEEQSLTGFIKSTIEQHPLLLEKGPSLMTPEMLRALLTEWEATSLAKSRNAKSVNDKINTIVRVKLGELSTLTNMSDSNRQKVTLSFVKDLSSFVLSLKKLKTMAEIFSKINEFKKKGDEPFTAENLEVPVPRVKRATAKKAVAQVQVQPQLPYIEVDFEVTHPLPRFRLLKLNLTEDPYLGEDISKTSQAYRRQTYKTCRHLLDNEVREFLKDKHKMVRLIHQIAVIAQIDAQIPYNDTVASLCQDYGIEVP
jgi:hypothetical protein